MARTMKEDKIPRNQSEFRFDDQAEVERLRTKYYKSHGLNKAEHVKLRYLINYVQLLARRRSSDNAKLILAKRRDFQGVSEGLKLPALREDYHSLTTSAKEVWLKNLCAEMYADLAKGPVQQGVDNIQANGSDTMHVAERNVSNLGPSQAGYAREGASNSGIGNTLPTGAPSQTVTCRQFANSPSQYVPSTPDDTVYLSDFNFPASFDSTSEGALVGSPNAYSRSILEEIPEPIPSHEDLQNVPSMREISSAEFVSSLLSSREPEAFGLSRDFYEE